jgi:hypothetical protein
MTNGILTVQFGDIRRWGRGRFVKQILEQPHAAFNRMTVPAVGIAHQDAGVSQDAATVQPFIEFHRAELRSRDASDAVMRGQEVINAREIGVEELEDRQVAPQNLAEKVDRFQPHGRGQLIVKAGVASVDDHALQELEIQPLLGELFDE